MNPIIPHSPPVDADFSILKSVKELGPVKTLYSSFEKRKVAIQGLSGWKKVAVIASTTIAALGIVMIVLGATADMTIIGATAGLPLCFVGMVLTAVGIVLSNHLISTSRPTEHPAQ